MIVLTLQILLVSAVSFPFAYVLMLWVLGPCVGLLVTQSGEYFDPKTSIETKVSRDKDYLMEKLIGISISVSLILCLSTLFIFKNIDSVYFWSPLLGVLLFGVFQAILFYQEVRDTTITHTYYFKTSEGFQLFLNQLGEHNWSEQANILHKKISPDSTDHAVANRLRSIALGQILPTKAPYERLSGNDPSIHYGPHTYSSQEIVH